MPRQPMHLGIVEKLPGAANANFRYAVSKEVARLRV
jgi:hypothetical protein